MPKITTLIGDVFVEKYNGSAHTCDKVLSVENGEKKTCENTAKIAITREDTKSTEYFCGQHARTTWEKWANQ